MLKWFIKHYKGGVTADQFRTFFPAINTGQRLSDMVFRCQREGSLNFKYIFIFKSRQRILSLCSVRKRMSIFIFNNRTLDRDSSGTIGFLELMLALDLVGADKWEWHWFHINQISRNYNFKRFQDEVSWAFKMFDIDNSGNIVVEEIRESVQVGRKG